jgi:hypothetical protein
MITSREWRDLLLRKRFGFGHDLDSKPSMGQMALFCPACPQPGINLPACKPDEPQYVGDLCFIFLAILPLRLYAGGCIAETLLLMGTFHWST